MRKDGEKTFFIHSFFFFGGKFRYKPQFDARDQFSEDYSLFEAECTYPFFPFSFELLV